MLNRRIYQRWGFHLDASLSWVGEFGTHSFRFNQSFFVLERFRASEYVIWTLERKFHILFGSLTTLHEWNFQKGYVGI